MPPAEMTAYRSDFDAACRRLGWAPVVVHAPTSVNPIAVGTRTCGSHRMGGGCSPNAT